MHKDYTYSYSALELDILNFSKEIFLNLVKTKGMKLLANPQNPHLRKSSRHKL